jgi:WD40 repeat protein
LNVLNLSSLNTLNGFSIGDLSLSSDGQFLLVESGKGQLIVYNTNTREQIATNTNGCSVPNGLYSRIAFEADSFIYIQSCWINQNQFSHTVYSWNISTDETRSVFAFEGDNITRVDTSPNGTILGVLAGSTLYLVNLDSGEILKEMGASGFTFDFSPDGRYLLLGDTIYGIPN